MEKTIYLAGGCFWGMERALQMLDGIISTTVGYANGFGRNPTYKEVCTDTTGYKETVKVVYDTRKLSLRKLMEAYFICIDPTQKNQQKHDVGSQYQVGVYYNDASDLPMLNKIFAEKKPLYPAFYVELEPLRNFYNAEDYHQNYLIKNPQGYCHISFEEFDKIKQLNLQKDRLRVYFAGSIRGGRQDAEIYRQVIDHLKQSTDVLTEHVGDLSLEVRQRPEDIYHQDTSWLKESDLVIAEVSTPSLGVGYELAYAEKLNIPCYLFCKPDVNLSAMLSGDSYYQIYTYQNVEQMLKIIDRILQEY